MQDPEKGKGEHDLDMLGVTVFTDETSDGGDDNVAVWTGLE